MEPTENRLLKRKRFIHETGIWLTWAITKKTRTGPLKKWLLLHGFPMDREKAILALKIDIALCGDETFDNPYNWPIDEYKKMPQLSLRAGIRKMQQELEKAEKGKCE